MTKVVAYCFPSGSNIGAQPGYVWVYLDNEHYTCSFWREDQVMKAVKGWEALGFASEERKRR
jgi:hypothetical protein